jgi:hypothetical protein
MTEVVQDEPIAPGAAVESAESDKGRGQTSRERLSVAAIAGAVLVAAGFIVWQIAGPSFADTPGDEVGLHYGGGVVEDIAFKGLIPPGTTNHLIGPFDDVYRYPASQQTYLASAEEGAQTSPIVAVTKDGVRIEVSGRLFFTLNAEESALRDFHETIGLSSGAFVNHGIEGMNNTLNRYVLPQLDRAIDVHMLEHEWLEIRSDPSLRPAFEAAVGAEVHDLVRQATGGEYFCGPGTPGGECTQAVFVVTRIKPMNADLSTFTEEQEKLDAEIANEQRRIEAEIANERRRLESEREQQQIENERIRAELEAIREQVAVLGVDGYVAMQQNEALREAVSSGNGNVYVVPQGSPLSLSQ